jgi:homeobox protein CDX
MNDMTSSPAAFGSPDYSNLGLTSGGSSSGNLPASAIGSLVTIDSGTADASSPSRSRHSPYAWMRKNVQVTGE